MGIEIKIKHKNQRWSQEKVYSSESALERFRELIDDSNAIEVYWRFIGEGNDGWVKEKYPR